MFVDKAFTYYAPGERKSAEEISKQAELFSDYPLINYLADTVSDFVVILNNERQIVYANESLIKYLNISREKIFGLRTGEIFGCQHAFETSCGCGTSEFCRTCGAVNAILNSQKMGKSDIRECSILQASTGNAMNFRVRTTPIKFQDENFIIAAFSDISDEKRRRTLEKIFFHDILNTACGLSGVVELLSRDKAAAGLDKYKKRLRALSEKLVDEIEAQRELSAAENNEIQVNPEIINIKEFLMETAELHAIYTVDSKRTIELDEISPELSMVSDRVILRRVIGNMIKNALEASAYEGKVRIGAFVDKSMTKIWVHNSNYIPRDIQLQIFNRSFSTKGLGRGLGTYSMKLLSERYLKGRISFTSSKENGTSFTASYSLNL